MNNENSITTGYPIEKFLKRYNNIFQYLNSNHYKNCEDELEKSDSSLNDSNKEFLKLLKELY